MDRQNRKREKREKQGARPASRTGDRDRSDPTSSGLTGKAPPGTPLFRQVNSALRSTDVGIGTGAAVKPGEARYSARRRHDAECFDRGDQKNTRGVWTAGKQFPLCTGPKCIDLMNRSSDTPMNSAATAGCERRDEPGPIRAIKKKQGNGDRTPGTRPSSRTGRPGPMDYSHLQVQMHQIATRITQNHRQGR